MTPTRMQSKLKKDTPSSLGYSMPAEWAKQEATWLSWPTNEITWPDYRLGEVREAYLQMIEALLPAQKVKLLINDAKTRDFVHAQLKTRSINDKNLITIVRPTVDGWIRDYGPTFITQKGKKAYVKWTFNAWGGKYKDLAEDTRVFENAKALVPQEAFEPGIVLEGGSIEVNGAGTCLTTEQCLLNKNRNPKLKRVQIEQLLKDYLGVSHIVWLEEGIVGDDTDGHIDDIARFVSPTAILAAFEDDEHDENHEILKKNWEILEQSKDQSGKDWDLIKLPMPPKIADLDVRLPASYANFLIANEVVLLPIFRHLKDHEAIEVLSEVFPKHKIVPIDANAMVYGLGAIHCLSQQEPAV